jgi:hypothetical protein
MAKKITNFHLQGKISRSDAKPKYYRQLQRKIKAKYSNNTLGMAPPLSSLSGTMICPIQGTVKEGKPVC